MTRTLPVFVAAVALLALPGCGWVIVEEDAPIHGLFWISQSSPGNAQATAAFRKIVDQGASEGPTEIDREGACWVDHYEPLAPNHARLVELDAGELRVTGGLEELVADYADGYEFPTKPAIFVAGDVLTLDVEGTDRVPAMSVTLPASPVPVITPAPATIDTSEDLTFTWTSAPGAGTLIIQVQGYWPDTGHGSGPRDIVRCMADVSLGTLTMPASLLSQITTDSSRATAYAYARNFERRDFGDSFVSFDVSTTAVTPSGKAYFLSAELK